MIRTGAMRVRVLLIAALAVCVSACPEGGGRGNPRPPDGTVLAWGDDSVGQLGDGMTSSISPTPVQVVDPSDPTGFLTGVTAVAAALFHTVTRR